jgi:hypothetical protein
MCYYLSGFLCNSVVHGIWVNLVGAGNDVNLARSEKPDVPCMPTSRWINMVVVLLQNDKMIYASG